jgi:hypothetical protein
LTDKPFGVNVMLLNPNAPEVAKVVVEEGVKIVTTGAGNPGKFMEMWKQAGVTVIPVVASVAMAKIGNESEVGFMDITGLDAALSTVSAYDIGFIFSNILLFLILSWLSPVVFHIGLFDFLII